MSDGSEKKRYAFRCGCVFDLNEEELRELTEYVVIDKDEEEAPKELFKKNPKIVGSVETITSLSSQASDFDDDITDEHPQRDPEIAPARRGRFFPVEDFKRVTESELRETKGEVRKFYKQQLKLLDFMEKDEKIRAKEACYLAEDASNSMNLKGFAGLNLVRGSFYANVGLMLLKGSALFMGNTSLTLVASFLDSTLDILAGVVMFLTDKFIHSGGKTDYFNYPIGKGKIEPIGILIFAVLMSFISFQVLLEAVKSLIMQSKDVVFNRDGVSTFVITITTKLGLYILCTQQVNVLKQYVEMSGVLSRINMTKTLAQDHINDVLSNSFGLVMAYYGANAYWYLDRIGAAVISAYILYVWLDVLTEKIKLLIGISATPEFLQRIAKVAAEHDPRIVALDHIEAYRYGNSYFVEVHIVLPPYYHLKECHDIGESLQKLIEEFPCVDKAYVHVDYSTDHDQEHKVLL